MVLIKSFNAATVVDEIKKSVMKHAGQPVNLQSIAMIASDLMNEKLTLMVRDRMQDMTPAELFEIASLAEKMTDKKKKFGNQPHSDLN